MYAIDLTYYLKSTGAIALAPGSVRKMENFLASVVVYAPEFDRPNGNKSGTLFFERCKGPDHHAARTRHRPPVPFRQGIAHAQLLDVMWRLLCGDNLALA